MRGRSLARLVVAAVVLLAACATSVRRAMPPVARDWLSTLQGAKDAARAGRYDEADRALYDFAQRHPGGPEAREASYWRAVFKLDPANRGESTRGAKEQLDEYLADTTGTLHRAEALALLRLASEIDSLGQPVPPVVALVDTGQAAEAQKAQQHEEELQKEVQHLKDSLDKTTKELDRIKKRLAEKNP